MTIKTTELLEFLTKAQKLSAYPTFRKIEDGYCITLYCDWDDDNDSYTRSVGFTNQGESNWDGDCDFHTMNSILDELLEKQEQKVIKEQKRKELISRLTDEEKELLGISRSEGQVFPF